MVKKVIIDSLQSSQIGSIVTRQNYEGPYKLEDVVKRVIENENYKIVFDTTCVENTYKFKFGRLEKSCDRPSLSDLVKITNKKSIKKLVSNCNTSFVIPNTYLLEDIQNLDTPIIIKGTYNTWGVHSYKVINRSLFDIGRFEKLLKYGSCKEPTYYDVEKYLEEVERLGLELLIPSSYTKLCIDHCNITAKDYFLEDYLPNITTYRVLILEDIFIQKDRNTFDIENGEYQNIELLANTKLFSEEIRRKLYASVVKVKPLLNGRWSSLDFSITINGDIVFHEFGIGFCTLYYTDETYNIFEEQLLQHVQQYDYMYGIE